MMAEKPKSPPSSQVQVKDKKQEDSKNHLYDEGVSQLLDSIALAAMETVSRNVVEQDKTIAKKAEDFEPTVSDRMTCSFCDVSFDERREQRNHYKSDWHRFNLKQKLKGLSPVSIEKFEEITAGDISSISGSDSESDISDNEYTEKSKQKTKVSAIPNHLQLDRQVSSGTDSESEMSYHIEGIGRRHPRVFFRNKQGELLSVYRCIIHGKKNQPESVEELISMACSLPKQTYWVMIMVAGGHFAAAVFKGSEVLVHKTFHRYVIRAKRGTIQSSRDSQGNAPKSGGASIRREQEKHLNEDIKALLESWSEHMKECDRIFLRATGSSRNIFFSGKGAPLSKNDTRIRMIPFPTRRPTHKEVLRVHSVLTTVETYGSESTISDFIPPSPVKKAPSKSKPDKTGSLRQAGSPARSSPKGSPHNSPRHKAVNKAKLSLETERAVSTSEDEDPVELGYTDEVVDLGGLQPFEVTRKPRRRKKDRKKEGGNGGQKHQKSPASDMIDEELYHVRNALYTACKTGNLDSLKDILSTSVPIKSFASPDSDQLQPSFQNNQSNSGSLFKCDQLQSPTDNSEFTSDSPNDYQISVDKEIEKVADNISKTDLTEENLTENSSEIKEADASSQVVPEEVLNMPFGDNGTTLLHVASKSNDKLIVVALLEAGANPAVKDKAGQTPYVAASSKETRNEFRKFMGRFPDRYDYATAQIPGPLTDEMEQEKKAKEAEKKRAQKKARKEKQKEQKAAEAEVRKEKQEKVRFLALSDREKRALAAEKRLAAQYTQQGQETPTLSRCFECAVDMTGKVPFEYNDYKFCTTKCLRAHRDKAKTAKS